MRKYGTATMETYVGAFPIQVGIKAVPYEAVYTVSATGTLGEQAVTVVGTVGSSTFRYLSPQTSPAPLAWASLTVSQAGINLLRMTCNVNLQSETAASWTCWQEGRDAFVLTRV